MSKIKIITVKIAIGENDSNGALLLCHQFAEEMNETLYVYSSEIERRDATKDEIKEAKKARG